MGLSLGSGSMYKQKTVFPKWLSLEKETMRELDRAVVRPSESCGTWYRRRAKLGHAFCDASLLLIQTAQ